MDIIYKSKFLCRLYCWVSQLRYPQFKKEVENRAKLDLFEYKQIAQPLPKCYYELCTDNNCFGIGWSIRHYTGQLKRKYINALSEHGYFFGSYVQPKEKIIFEKRILTFSDVRKKYIEDAVSGKDVYPIGPYIHYAPQYYDEERLFREKEKLGRVLLVFFSHSSTGVSVSFDVDFLVDKINSIRNRFDTVVVSLFWSDINPTIENRLLKEGYRIFSSGHRYDYYFLSRQKTMITLADMTMSNAIGTHIAYCCYLGKPHWVVRQDIKEIAVTPKGKANIAISKKIDNEPESAKQQDELYTVFSNYSEVLTFEQKEICNKLFGFDRVRTPCELLKFI